MNTKQKNISLVMLLLALSHAAASFAASSYGDPHFGTSSHAHDRARQLFITQMIDDLGMSREAAAKLYDDSVEQEALRAELSAVPDTAAAQHAPAGIGADAVGDLNAQVEQWHELRQHLSNDLVFMAVGSSLEQKNQVSNQIAIADGKIAALEAQIRVLQGGVGAVVLDPRIEQWQGGIRQLQEVLRFMPFECPQKVELRAQIAELENQIRVLQGGVGAGAVGAAARVAVPLNPPAPFGQMFAGLNQTLGELHRELPRGVVEPMNVFQARVDIDAMIRVDAQDSRNPESAVNLYRAIEAAFAAAQAGRADLWAGGEVGAFGQCNLDVAQVIHPRIIGYIRRAGYVIDFTAFLRAGLPQGAIFQAIEQAENEVVREDLIFAAIKYADGNSQYVILENLIKMLTPEQRSRIPKGSSTGNLDRAIKAVKIDEIKRNLSPDEIVALTIIDKLETPPMSFFAGENQRPYDLMSYLRSVSGSSAANSYNIRPEFFQKIMDDAGISAKMQKLWLATRLWVLLSE